MAILKIPTINRDRVKKVNLSLNQNHFIYNKIGNGDIWLYPGESSFVGINRTKLTYTATTKKVDSALGSAIQGSLNTNDGAEIASSLFSSGGWAGLTVLALCYFDGYSSANSAMILREARWDGKGISLSFLSTNMIRGIISTTGSELWTASADASVDSNPGWYIFAMTYDGANRHLYQGRVGCPAKLLRSDACTGNISIQHIDATFVVQGGKHSSAIGFNKPQIYTMCLEFPLSTAEVSSLSLNPFSFLNPSKDLMYFIPEGGLTETAIFDGKINIKDTATSLFDGKVQISDVTTSNFDGLISIQNTQTSNFDGKVIIKDVATSNFDGTVIIQDTTTDLFDGKVIIQNSATSLFDGTIIIQDSATSLFDGKLTITTTGIETATFDGKVNIKDTTSSVFDGKVQISDVSTSTFDGKVIISNVATSVFDGKIIVQGVQLDTQSFDAKVIIKDTTTSTFDGKIIIADGVYFNLWEDDIFITRNSSNDVYITRNVDFEVLL